MALTCPTMPLRTLVLGMLIVSVTACSKTVTWTEEVELSNGQTIMIERDTHHRLGGAEWARGSGLRPEQYVIRFKYPPGSNREIEWKSTKMELERGSEPEFPLLLDVMPPNDVPFIITFHGLRGFCYEYVRYVFSNGVWAEGPLAKEFEARDANLYLSASALDLSKQISSTLKRNANTDSRYRKRLRQIGPKQTIAEHKRIKGVGVI